MQNFCWHLRDLFSAELILYKLLCRAVSWWREPGWAGKPGWTHSYENSGWVWHFQLWAQNGVIFSFDRVDFSLLSRSLLQVCSSYMWACWALEGLLQGLANSSCDVPACEGLVKASQGKPGWNCCFSIVFYWLSLREKMLHLNYSTASSLGLPHVGSGDQEGSAPTKRWEKKSRSKSWNLWPLQVVPPLP